MSKHYKETYKVGDKVIITAKYSNYYNKEGVITKIDSPVFGIAPIQVTIEGEWVYWCFHEYIKPAKEQRFKQLMNLYEQHKKTEDR